MTEYGSYFNKGGSLLQEVSTVILWLGNWSRYNGTSVNKGFGEWKNLSATTRFCLYIKVLFHTNTTVKKIVCYTKDFKIRRFGISNFQCIFDRQSLMRSGCRWRFDSILYWQLNNIITLYPLLLNFILLCYLCVVVVVIAS